MYYLLAYCSHVTVSKPHYIVLPWASTGTRWHPIQYPMRLLVEHRMGKPRGLILAHGIPCSVPWGPRYNLHGTRPNTSRSTSVGMPWDPHGSAQEVTWLIPWVLVQRRMGSPMGPYRTSREPSTGRLFALFHRYDGSPIEARVGIRTESAEIPCFPL